MQRLLLTIFAVLSALSAADTKSDTVTYVTHDDVLATLQRAPEKSVSDQQVRVVDVGKYNVAVGVVYRSPRQRRPPSSTIR